MKNVAVCLLISYLGFCTQASGQSGIISTVAGNGTGGFSGDGGPATSAKLSGAMDVAVDASGNLYVVEEGNGRVRKVSPAGIITTFAGGGSAAPCSGGPATSSSLFLPSSITFDASGNLFIADRGGNLVCRVSASGAVTAVAGNGTYGFSGDGGPAASASLAGPSGVAVDAAGNIFIADSNNSRVRKVSPGGIITTVAGNGIDGYSGDGGPATSASLSGPWGVAVDAAGNLYISDPGNRRIREVSAGGIIGTLAGNGDFELGPNGDGGPASLAELSLPFGIKLDASGDLFIADGGDNRIRRISGGGIITTVAGNGTQGFSGDGGPASRASLNDPHGVAIDAAGDLYIAQYGDNRVREVSAAGPDQIENLVLTGTATCSDSYCRSFGSGPITGTYSLDVTAQAIVGPWSFTTPFGTISSTDAGASASVTVANLVEPYFQIQTSTALEFVKFDFPATDLQQTGPIQAGPGSDGCINIPGGETGQPACDPDYLITGTTAPAAPTIPVVTVSPASLSFSVIAGGSSSRQQISLAGTPGAAWSASASSNWITLAPTSGTVPATIAVGVNTASLQPGSYSASITISNPSASPPQETVSVSLTVTPVGGTLSVAPVALTYQVPQAAPAQSQPVQIGGTAGVAWQATASTSTGGAWLSISPAQGQIPASPNVSLNFASLAPGTYQGSIDIQAPGATPSSATIAITLTVATASAQGGIITTVAGSSNSVAMSGNNGNGGPATSGVLYFPADVAVGASGNASGNLFISDRGANRIAKVSSTGIITTIAGIGPSGFPGAFSGDGGQATAASIYDPRGIKVDAAGNVFFADSMNKRIRKVSPGGIITTVAGNGAGAPDQLQIFFSGDGGPATAAELSFPFGIAVDAAGDLFIADTNNQRIRKVSSSGIITTVAGNPTTCIDFAVPVFCAGFSGDGEPATSALFSGPTGVAVDAAGNLYIADGGNNRIRKVSASGIVTTVAGNGTQGFSGDGGPATSAALNNPFDVTVDAAGNLFIVDFGNNRIRKVSAGGIITTVAGSGVTGFTGDGGLATAAALDEPTGVAVDASGNFFIADASNNRIREVSAPITTPPAPSIAPGGTGPIYSTANTIQPGEWVTIHGSALAGSTVIANGGLLTSLGGTSVTIDGKPAYLIYVSPSQINLQAPDDTMPGPVAVVVTTANGNVASTVTLAPFGPSFFQFDSVHVAGIILRSDGSGAYGGGIYDLIGPTGNSLGYRTVAAKAGDNLELYAVGLGPTSPAVPAGQEFSGAAPTTNPVTILINGVNVIPTFVGLSGTATYQINLVIPAGLGTGDVPLEAIVGGVRTPSTAVISLQ